MEAWREIFGTTSMEAEAHDADRYLEMLPTLARKAEFITESVGQSTGGRTLYALRRESTTGAAPHVLLSTGIHGDEPAGPWAVLSLLAEQALSAAVNWTVLPLINPDGLAAGSRENADGLDLNRDFKLQRSAEICALSKVFDAMAKVDLHLSLHEDWEYDQSYLYEINTGARTSFAEALLECAKANTGLVEAALIDGHTPCAPGLIRHAPDPDEPEGWPEAIYLVKKHPLLSYTLETPSRQPLAARIACHRAVITAAVAQLGGAGGFYSKSSS